ncbi:MAG: N-acetylglucosamine kinase [Chitinophagaceae bacterium]|nr:MAG: N-acetylglucosamine kinase [Chitinophagaceae bacterium]
MKNRYILIADSGSSKTSWCLLSSHNKQMTETQGISPYFMTKDQIKVALEKELLPVLTVKATDISEVYFYGTGLADPKNARLFKSILENTFGNSEAYVTHDLMGAARALCGHEQGIACILGTGSNSCYYNGSKIVRNNPGLGFILGDEGSGAVLGKKVIQYYLYQTFDEELKSLFEKKFNTTKEEILLNVYKKPYPNRYLASFSYFLYENRGHYMIENILEDGLNDFFFYHICKYAGSWEYPVHFTGGVAWAYKDVILELCDTYGMTPGNILKAPIKGLICYHEAEMNIH